MKCEHSVVVQVHHKRDGEALTFFENHKAATLVVINMILLFVVIGVIETVLGMAEGEAVFGEKRYIELREYPPLRTLRLSPPEEYMTQTDNLRKKVYKLRIDENGFIMPSSTHSSPDYVIAFLGGSTTECGFVSEQFRFHVVVGQLLSKSRRKVNTINAAYSGNTTLHSLNTLVNKVLPVGPDMAVLLQNWNDLIVLLYTDSYWSEARGTVHSLKEMRSPTGLIKSAMKLVVPNISLRLRAILSRETPDEFAAARGKPVNIDKTMLEQEYTKLLRTFIAVCRSNGIEPVLMTQATRLSPMPDAFTREYMKRLQTVGLSMEAFYDLHKRFNEIVRTESKMNNIVCVDLERHVPPRKGYFYDIMHLNDSGSLLAGQIIVRDLEESGVLNLCLDEYKGVVR